MAKKDLVEHNILNQLGSGIKGVVLFMDHFWTTPPVSMCNEAHAKKVYEEKILCDDVKGAFLGPIFVRAFCVCVCVCSNAAVCQKMGVCSTTPHAFFNLKLIMNLHCGISPVIYGCFWFSSMEVS